MCGERWWRPRGRGVCSQGLGCALTTLKRGQLSGRATRARGGGGGGVRESEAAAATRSARSQQGSVREGSGKVQGKCERGEVADTRSARSQNIVVSSSKRKPTPRAMV